MTRMQWDASILHSDSEVLLTFSLRDDEVIVEMHFHKIPFTSQSDDVIENK